MMERVATRSVPERILCPICRASNRADARFCQQCGNDVLLDNIYRITRVIKEGGMGVVYQAVDEDGEFYAVKEMHDRFTDPAERIEGIERFIEEAQLLKKLKGHPNIPHIYRSFIDEGRYYLSMEFIFGEDLEDVLKRQGRFPEPQVLRWADQLCDVLEYLHNNGLIYRDMKPSNVMITRDGNIKVVDFGIAKLLQPGQRGTMVGTPGYSPPEQYQGIATPQSDVFALGATLHHLLTGRDPRDEPPFSFPPARSLRRDISQQTSDAIQKALEMELADRFRTMSEFRRALPIPTGERRPTLPFEPQPRATTRRPPPAPRPQPVAPRPSQRAQPQQRRRGGGFGRAVRRVVGTAIIAAGLYFGAVQYGPELISLAQEYLSAQTGGSGSAPAEQAPAEQAPAEQNPGVQPALQEQSVTFEITVPEGTTRAEVLQQFRDQFVEQVRQQNGLPDAQPGSTPPSSVGPLEEVSRSNGNVTYRARMRGFVDVPQQ